MKKTYWYILIGLVVVVAVWYFFIRAKTPAASGSEADYGLTKSGKQITDSMITTEMRSIESYNKKFIQDKAKTNNVSYNEQLRLDAIWMLQNAEGH